MILALTSVVMYIPDPWPVTEATFALVKGDGAPATGPLASFIVTGPAKKNSMVEGKYNSALWKRNCGAYFFARRTLASVGALRTRAPRERIDKKSVTVLKSDFWEYGSQCFCYTYSNKLTISEREL